MTDTIHSCSYYCQIPACIKAQRDELREKLCQRTWVGLSNEEIERDFYERYDFVRSIEAKLKEKNNA